MVNVKYRPEVNAPATWSTLGNLQTMTAPGNNAATSITTTYNYNTGGSYHQSEVLGEPILVDALSNVRLHVGATQNERNTRRMAYPSLNCGQPKIRYLTSRSLFRTLVTVYRTVTCCILRKEQHPN